MKSIFEQHFPLILILVDEVKQGLGKDFLICKILSNAKGQSLKKNHTCRRFVWLNRIDFYNHRFIYHVRFLQAIDNARDSKSKACTVLQDGQFAVHFGIKIDCYLSFYFNGFLFKSTED